VLEDADARRPEIDGSNDGAHSLWYQGKVRAFERRALTANFGRQRGAALGKIRIEANFRGGLSTDRG